MSVYLVPGVRKPYLTTRRPSDHHDILAMFTAEYGLFPRFTRVSFDFRRKRYRRSVCKA